MPQNYPTIDEVVRLLGLERKPYGTSYKVRCPFCQGNDGKSKKYHMDINVQKNAYYCFHCEAHGGVLDLYSRVKFGTPVVKGQNSKEIFRKLQEERGQSGTFQYKKMVDVDSYKEIYPVADKRLNEVYQSLLSFPEFKLTDQHMNNLLKRGLMPSSIERNGYRSITSDTSWVSTNYRARAVFETLQIEDDVRQYHQLSHYSKDRMISSMIVGEYVKSAVGDPERVPGFFRLKGRWFFRMDEGLIIPTRNHKGEIIALQMRKDSGDLRYMTVSSKGLPEGVTTRIARTHFPLGNNAFGKDTAVMITEGPLKADAAIELMSSTPGRHAFIALHGVNAKQDLPNIFQYLKSIGIEAVYNCFDMDRLLNPNVMKATAGMADMAKKAGLRFKSLYWDEAYGREKVKDLQRIIEERFPDAEFAEPWYDQLRRMTIFLNDQKIPYVKEWNPSTKGIDDYLLSQRKAQ